MAMDRMTEVGLGIDVGGTGVKAALVELAGGELLTPDPATPEAVAALIGGLRPAPARSRAGS
jgi:polyphosphate glucokinase